jgi:hypothetical protein
MYDFAKIEMTATTVAQFQASLGQLNVYFCNIQLDHKPNPHKKVNE